MSMAKVISIAAMTVWSLIYGMTLLCIMAGMLWIVATASKEDP